MPHSIQVLLVEDNQGDASLIHEALREQSQEKFNLILGRCLSPVLGNLQTNPPDILLINRGLPDSMILDAQQQMRTTALGQKIDGLERFNQLTANHEV